MQDDGAVFRVLDHDALDEAHVDALGGRLAGQGGGGERGEGVEAGAGRGRGDERGEGVVGEVEGDGGVL